MRAVRRIAPGATPALLAWLLALSLATPRALAGDIRRIELTVLDPQAIGYGTFQSHNQKVLSNAAGIFTTHNRTQNEKYTAQTWRLSRSTDGGKTFATVYEDTHATHPPAIETDEQSNIYLVRSDDTSGDAYFYRFDAKRAWREPTIAKIPGAAAGKFVLLRDPQRKQLYFSSLPGVFFVIGEDGVRRAAVQLFQRGPHALHHYPLLSLDEAGVLHYAYTTTPIDNSYLYWSIHYAQSPDGGNTWQKMDGTKLTPPVVADETGPTDRVSLDDEFKVHTWLSNLLVGNGKAHFLYEAMHAPPGQHYARYDLKTAKRDLDLYPTFKGETLSLLGLDGFFVAGEGSTLFAIGHSKAGGIVCLRSDDAGTTWHDFAATDPATAPKKIYAIGGCRWLTADGHIIGTFTDHTDPGPVNVRLLKIPTR